MLDDTVHAENRVEAGGEVSFPSERNWRGKKCGMAGEVSNKPPLWTLKRAGNRIPNKRLHYKNLQTETCLPVPSKVNFRWFAPHSLFQGWS